jgi:hypothetical protein
MLCRPHLAGYGDDDDDIFKMNIRNLIRLIMNVHPLSRIYKICPAKAYFVIYLINSDSPGFARVQC